MFIVCIVLIHFHCQHRSSTVNPLANKSNFRPREFGRVSPCPKTTHLSAEWYSHNLHRQVRSTMEPGCPIAIYSITLGWMMRLISASLHCVCTFAIVARTSSRPSGLSFKSGSNVYITINTHLSADGLAIAQLVPIACYEGRWNKTGAYER